MQYKNHTPYYCVIQRCVHAALVLTLLCPGMPLLAGGDNSNTLGITEIADGNYLHTGVHVPFEHEHHDDIANIGFIVGDTCVAVIDTGGSVAIGKALRETIRTVTDKPICYVINTHVHFDHVLGNLAFKNDDPEYIGHTSLADAIESNRGFFLQEFSEDLGPDPGEDSVIGPDRTVADKLELDLGGRKLLLTSYPPAHTHADLTVLDKKTRTLWTGDLLFRERIPALDGDLKGWIAIMEELKIIDVNRIIPGHGKPGETWNETMTAQKNYLTTLLIQTRKGIAEGLFMEEAIETIGEDEKKKWLLHEQHHKSNVSKAFTQLEWE